MRDWIRFSCASRLANRQNAGTIAAARGNRVLIMMKDTAETYYPVRWVASRSRFTDLLRWGRRSLFVVRRAYESPIQRAPERSGVRIRAGPPQATGLPHKVETPGIYNRHSA